MVASPGWCSHFQNFHVEVMAARSSDHKPLWVSFPSSLIRSQQRRSFQFEASWNIDAECEEVIKSVWGEAGEEGNALAETRSKLHRCKSALSEWSCWKLGAVPRTIKRLSRSLEKLQRLEGPGNVLRIKQVQGEIQKLLEMENIHWKQRAKRNWFKEGDKNTKFFHAWAIQRWKKNFIHQIKDDEGMSWNQQDEIGEAFRGYF